MNILMIDTSGPACGVAIMADGRLVYEAELTHRQTHSQRVMPMVDTALQMSDMTAADMDVFGAVVGPGSFTGVRIGVSTVKALAHAANKPCVAVDALEALAANVTAFDGVVCPILDARAQQVYGAIFRRGERLTEDTVEKLTLFLDRVEATGELSRLCYRAEIEAVMRTEEMSGISLLGLQDFPGQGTALVGMLNSHLQPKPYDFARPERFRAFFDGVLPLALLPRYCYETGETLEAEIRVANSGRRPLRGALRYTLICGITRLAGELAGEGAPCGALTRLGTIRIALPEAETAHRFMLQLEMDGVKNAYPVWVYPRVKPRRPETVWETEHFDVQTERVLEAGGVVYLSPAATKEALPQSIGTQFSTDFWSVGTFPKQEGGMGQLIESGHPVFEGFPTDSHTDWQWWHMAGQRALIVPAGLKAIVTEMDSYAYMRPMAQLFEARCGSGRVLVSSFGLQNLQQYPEARALLGSIYGYLASDAFAPCQRVEPELLRALVP